MPQQIESVARSKEVADPAGGAIAAFIFDVDGVIADTATLHEAAWRQIARREGIEIDAGTAQALRGTPRDASLRLILGNRRVPLRRFNELMEEKNADYLRRVEALGPADVLPGTLALLDQLRSMGMGIAAASASRNARRVLQQLQIDGRFDAIVDGADEATSSAGLHRYLLAAGALRVAPGRCVVVEDSPTGVATARQFGMLTVGLGNGNALCAASIVFESLRGVDASCLTTWLGGGASVGPAEFPAL